MQALDCDCGQGFYFADSLGAKAAGGFMLAPVPLLKGGREGA